MFDKIGWFDLDRGNSYTGDLATVTHVEKHLASPNLTLLALETDRGAKCLIGDEGVELVTEADNKNSKPEAKFKVGDTVEVVENRSCGWATGTIGTVKDVGYEDVRNRYWYGLSATGKDYTMAHYEKELKLLVGKDLSSTKKEGYGYTWTADELDAFRGKAPARESGKAIVTSTQKPIEKKEKKEKKAATEITFIDYSMLVIG